MNSVFRVTTVWSPSPIRMSFRSKTMRRKRKKRPRLNAFASNSRRTCSASSTARVATT